MQFAVWSSSYVDGDADMRSSRYYNRIRDDDHRFVLYRAIYKPTEGDYIYAVLVLGIVAFDDHRFGFCMAIISLEIEGDYIYI